MTPKKTTSKPKPQVLNKVQQTKKTVAAETAAATVAKKPKTSSPPKLPKHPKGSSSEPQTMSQLLKQEGVELRNLKRGDVVEGTVTDLGPKSVYVDVGSKTEGLVNDKEYHLAESYIKTLEIGDQVDAYVLTPENETGQIILSLRQAADNFVWIQLEEWHSTGEVLTVKVKETNRGGAVVSVIDQIDGFIPSSQFTGELQNKIDQLINKTVDAKIIDLSRQETKIILSEKAVSEAEDIAKKRAALEQLTVGREYNCTVTRVVPFGIFVRLESEKAKETDIQKVESNVSPPAEDVEGLVHISEMSWEKIDNPSELYKLGDNIKVQVLEVQPKVGKLALSVKRLTPDPWESIDVKLPVDKQLLGEVTEVLPFGIFVRLEPGVSGLIHSSKLLGETYNPGDKVNVYIESVDLKNRRISLGLVLTTKPVGYK